MSEQTPSSPAPGWYPNPEGEGLRWWDGSTWTEHVHVESPTLEPTLPVEPITPSPVDTGSTPPPGVGAPPASATTRAPAAAGLPAASGSDGPTRIFGVRLWVLLVLAAVVSAALLLPMVIFDDDVDEPEPEPAPAKQDGSGKKSGDTEAEPGVSLLAVSDLAGGYLITAA